MNFNNGAIVCGQSKSPNPLDRGAGPNNETENISTLHTLPKIPTSSQLFQKLNLGALIYWRSDISRARIASSIGTRAYFGRVAEGG